MAYKAIMRHSDFGRDRLLNSIDDYDHEGVMTEDEKDDMLGDLINQIAGNLPDDLDWDPNTSEILADVNEEDKYDVYEIREIFNRTIEGAFES